MKRNGDKTGPILPVAPEQPPLFTLLLRVTEAEARQLAAGRMTHALLGEIEAAAQEGLEVLERWTLPHPRPTAASAGAESHRPDIAVQPDGGGRTSARSTRKHSGAARTKG